MDTHHKFYLGDSLDVLRKLPDESVNTCVTSPPYWGLRDYGVEGQMGLEETVEEYVTKMSEVFREVRRVLNKDGTLWLNLGDTYSKGKPRTGEALHNGGYCNSNIQSTTRVQGLKPKNIIGIPWRVAFALQSDGWYLRSDIIWNKPNAMPESITDRPTCSHEYIFLLSKSEKYYYDHEAIKEDAINGDPSSPRGSVGVTSAQNSGRRKQDDLGKRTYTGFNNRYEPLEKRNKRSVWEVSTVPNKEAHFAMFPEKLIFPCILAGCPEVGTVLDPFGGAGTTSMVSKKLGRNSIYIDLNSEYLQIALCRMEFDKMEFFATHTYEVVS